MVIYGCKLNCTIERIQLKDKRSTIEVIMFIGRREGQSKIKKIFFAFANPGRDPFYIPHSVKEGILQKDDGFWNFIWVDNGKYKVIMECIDRQSNYIKNLLISQLYKKTGKRIFKKIFVWSGKIVLD